MSKKEFPSLLVFGLALLLACAATAVAETGGSAQKREEAARLTVRDAADSGRSLAPLRKAADAVELDTTDLEPSEVVDRIVALAKQVRAEFG